MAEDALQKAIREALQGKRRDVGVIGPPEAADQRSVLLREAVRKPREKASQEARKKVGAKEGETATEKLRRVPGTLEHAMARLDGKVKMDPGTRGRVLSYLFARSRGGDTVLPVSNGDLTTAYKAVVTGDFTAVDKAVAEFRAKRSEASALKSALEAERLDSPEGFGGDEPPDISENPVAGDLDRLARVLSAEARAVYDNGGKASTAIARALMSASPLGAAAQPALPDEAVDDMAKKTIAASTDPFRALGDVGRALDPARDPGDRLGSALNVAGTALGAASFFDDAAKAALRAGSKTVKPASVPPAVRLPDDVPTAAEEALAEAAAPVLGKSEGALRATKAKSAKKARLEAPGADGDAPAGAVEGPVPPVAEEAAIDGSASPESLPGLAMGPPAVKAPKPLSKREARRAELAAERAAVLERIKSRDLTGGLGAGFGGFGPGHVALVTEDVRDLVRVVAMEFGNEVGIVYEKVGAQLRELLGDGYTPELDKQVRRAVRTEVELSGKARMEDLARYAVATGQDFGAMRPAKGSYEQYAARTRGLVAKLSRLEDAEAVIAMGPPPDLDTQVAMAQAWVAAEQRFQRGMQAVDMLPDGPDKAAAMARLDYDRKYADTVLPYLVENNSTLGRRMNAIKMSVRPSASAQFSYDVAKAAEGAPVGKLGAKTAEAVEKARNRLAAAEEALEQAKRSEGAVKSALRANAKAGARVALTGGLVRGPKSKLAEMYEAAKARARSARPGRTAGAVVNVPQEVADIAVMVAYHWRINKTYGYDELFDKVASDVGGGLSEPEFAAAARAFFDTFESPPRASQDVIKAKAATRAKAEAVASGNEGARGDAIGAAVKYARLTGARTFDEVAESAFLLLGDSFDETEVADAVVRSLYRKKRALTDAEKRAAAAARRESLALKKTAEAVTAGRSGLEGLSEYVRFLIGSGATDLDDLVRQTVRAYPAATREQVVGAASDALFRGTGRRAASDATRAERLRLVEAQRDAQKALALLRNRVAWARKAEESAMSHALRRAGISIAKTYSFSRGAKASLDMQYLFRQGWVLGLRSPKDAAKAFARSAKATTVRGYADVLDEVSLHKHHDLADQSGLGFQSALKSEDLNESFVGGFPGGGRLGDVLRAGVDMSDRQHSAFLSWIRMITFGDIVDGYLAAGLDVTPETAKAIARYVNRSSGRGQFADAKSDNVVSGLNSYLFSARWVLSNLQNASGWTLVDAVANGGGVRSPLAKRAAADAFRVLTAQATVVYLANLAASQGADVGEAPRGKVRYKSKTLDFGANIPTTVSYLWPVLRDSAQAAMGKKRERESVFDDGAFNDLFYWLGQKRNPGVAFMANLANQKDPVGRDTDLLKEAGSLFVPIGVGNVARSAFDPDDPGIQDDEAVAALLEFFGVGSGDYRPKKEKRGQAKTGSWDAPKRTAPY